ncbi:unnamed protein product [Spodoptera littoralis]|uniref:Uncharacterized protein n=1 Tax=Spodoptera littoralis TaxID=7109 RepID=A0A9P0IBU8_SPOLI|nr:unnamed protein product [Spodoptera littoralis]CAH1643855.1 unnamed protein product [Spodoptera littoralis]
MNRTTNIGYREAATRLVTPAKKINGKGRAWHNSSYFHIAKFLALGTEGRGGGLATSVAPLTRTLTYPHVTMDRRCSQSVRTLVFDDSDSDPPKLGQKKDLSSTGAPLSLNQSAEGR